MVNKKRRNKIIIWWVIAIFTFLVGAFAINQGLQQFSITGTQIIANPIFGKITCQFNTEDTTGLMTISKNGITIRADSLGDATDVQLTIETEKETIPCDKNRIRYSICDLRTGGCRISNGIIFIDNCQIKNTNILSKITHFEEIKINYEDSCIFSDDCKKQFVGDFGAWKPLEGAKYSASFRKYALFKDDPKSPEGFISQDCGNIKAIAEDEISFFEGLITSSDKAEITDKPFTTNSLNPGESWSYLSFFVLSPYEEETFNGQLAYCVPKTDGSGIGNMYGFSNMETTQGNFKITDFSNLLGTVECCNGVITLNKKCVNHKWVDIEQSQCSLPLNPCPITDFAIDVADPNRKTVFKEECINNICERIIQEVECASSFACPPGETCIGFKCEESGGGGGDVKPTTCGNGVCDIGETSGNCIEDCKPNYTPLYILGAGIILAILLYFTRRNSGLTQQPITTIK